MRIRVLVVARVRIYREGLAEILTREPRVAVVATGVDRDDGLAQVRACRPDVALLDLDVPDICSLVSTTRVEFPDVKVVALGMLEEDDDVIACVEAGAAGYVSRDGSVADLLRSVESAAKGEMPISPKVAARLAKRVVMLSGALRLEHHHPSLTQREAEIAELIEQGLTNKQIAQQLCIELPTVKNHVHHILGKLEVQRRGEAAAMLRRLRLDQVPQ